MNTDAVVTGGQGNVGGTFGGMPRGMAIKSGTFGGMPRGMEKIRRDVWRDRGTFRGTFGGMPFFVADGALRLWRIFQT